MKAWGTIMIILAIGALVASCKGTSRDEERRDDREARYLDLTTGESVDLEQNPSDGSWFDRETGEVVDIYVDTKTGDTIWGNDGTVINGRVRHDEEGNYVYLDADMNSVNTHEGTESSDGAYSAKEPGATGYTKVVRTGDEYKIKRGDYKKEVEKDGDITIKNGDLKIKIDGKTGERKVKRD